MACRPGPHSSSSDCGSSDAALVPARSSFRKRGRWPPSRLGPGSRYRIGNGTLPETEGSGGSRPRPYREAAQTTTSARRRTWRRTEWVRQRKVPEAWVRAARAAQPGNSRRGAPPVAHRRRDGKSATGDGDEHTMSRSNRRRHRSCSRLHTPTGQPLFYRS